MPPDNIHAQILDNLKTAILLIEADLSVSYLNPAAEALLEASCNKVIREPVAKLFSESDGLLDSIHNKNPITKREARLNLASGQQIIVDCAVTPAEDGRMLIEIQALDRMMRINREEGLIISQQNTQELVRGMAHEIKNPLGGLRGAAQLLARELHSEELTDYTNIIIEEADRLGKLVDRMLGSNKLLNIQTLNIHEILERVKALVIAETRGKIQIERDYDPSIPELEGDREQLIQAVLNIVRNAMQALEGGGTDKPPTITLKTRTMRQLTIGTIMHRLVCRVDIIDTGPGIDEDIRNKIFLPMVSGRADGTGLGLAISQSIINHHKGLIECTSEPGHTVFTLYIPLEQAQ
jgi:two-component system nitrogen regulation sensor histidine kinase GlnL